MPKTKKSKNAPAPAGDNGAAAPHATKPKRARQESLPTLEPISIKALDDAVEDYQDLKVTRMQTLEKEVAAKLLLGELMRKHKVTVYKTPTDLTASLEEETKVKVKRAKEDTESDADD